MKVAFCTLGCKVNQYDTDAMREMFINAGHTVVDFDDIADVSAGCSHADKSSLAVE